jgi:lipopolysaccharide transport protein LptA
MIAALVLLLGCVPPPQAEQPLPEGISLAQVELRLPGQGLLIRAAHAEIGDQQLGRASQVDAQLGEGLGLSIRADSASWDLRGQSVVFEGGVDAVRGAFTLRCERLDASFSSPERLQRAVASGQVRVIHGDRVASAERAVLEVESGRLELEGQPLLRDGGRSLRGERIVLFLDDERLECERCALEIDAGLDATAEPAGAEGPAPVGEQEP